MKTENIICDHCGCVIEKIVGHSNEGVVIIKIEILYIVAGGLRSDHFDFCSPGCTAHFLTKDGLFK